MSDDKPHIFTAFKKSTEETLKFDPYGMLIRPYPPLERLRMSAGLFSSSVTSRRKVATYIDGCISVFIL